MLCLWYPEVQDHGLPCTVQQVGGTFPSDAIPHDWQVILQQKGSMGAAPSGAPAGLQQHPVSGQHYLMFGRHPHLPVDYYFPMVSAYECSRHVPAYVTEVRRHFKEAYAEVHLQTNCEAEKQKHYYDRATSTAQLVPGDAVLMKNDASQGKQKVKDWWSETEYVVICQVADGIPAYEVKDEAGSVKTVHRN